MKTRTACLLGLGAMWATCFGFLACGSSSGGFADGGSDASTDTTTTFDVSQPDGNGSDTKATDSGHDAGGEAGSKDSGLVGHCSAVNGPACDIVLQNCKTGQECVIVNDPTAESGLGATTSCQPVQSSEHLAQGSKCCPGDTNFCDPGTTCIGDPCIGDAGAGGGGGRCTPACCPSTDGGPNTANCGLSNPEGYIGTCDIQITDNDGGVYYTACTYEGTCTVFVKPCPSGDTCLVEGVTGTSKCTTIYEPPGLASGANCGTISNACAPGMSCTTFLLKDGGTPKTGGICTYYCSTGTGSPPFDAGVLTSTPGMGGCPSMYSCEGAPFLPSWLGVCAPPAP